MKTASPSPAAITRPDAVQTSLIDRRSHKRLHISADAIMTIMVPDETFSPQTVRGAATDISYSGLRIKSFQLKKADYIQLMRGVRYAKVDLFLPFDVEPLPLRARIVWISYHDETRLEKAHCDLGLSYERLPKVVEERLSDAIARLEQESYNMPGVST